MAKCLFGEEGCTSETHAELGRIQARETWIDCPDCCPTGIILHNDCPRCCDTREIESTV